MENSRAMQYPKPRTIDMNTAMRMPHADAQSALLVSSLTCPHLRHSQRVGHHHCEEPSGFIAWSSKSPSSYAAWCSIGGLPYVLCIAPL